MIFLLKRTMKRALPLKTFDLRAHAKLQTCACNVHEIVIIRRGKNFSPLPDQSPDKILHCAHPFFIHDPDGLGADDRDIRLAL